MFNKQKKYFVQKADGIQKMIWDQEFKRAKTLEIREGIRKAYDESAGRLTVLKQRISSAPEKEKGTDEFKRLEDEVVRLEKEIETYKNQMKQCDLDITGSKQTNEYPEGLVGVDQNLESLRELQAMVKKYIKTI